MGRSNGLYSIKCQEGSYRTVVSSYRTVVSSYMVQLNFNLTLACYPWILVRNSQDVCVFYMRTHENNTFAREQIS